MLEEQDPALSPESVSDDAGATVADPQAMEEAAESPEESGEGAGTPQDDKQDQAEGLEIVVEGEEPLPPAPKESAAWAKLRKEKREAQVRAAELEQKLRAYEQPAQADPGPKPTLADCNFDEGELETKLLGWHERKRRDDEAKAKAAQRADEDRRDVQSKLDAFAKRDGELSTSIKGYAEAKATAVSALGADARAMILKYSNDPALVFCALGLRPKRLEELSKETDPIRFAFKLKDLEANLKTKPTSKAPPPEKPVNGSGAVSGTTDSTLERLRAKADKTGDRTEVVQYLQKKREAERGK